MGKVRWHTDNDGMTCEKQPSESSGKPLPPNHQGRRSDHAVTLILMTILMTLVMDPVVVDPLEDLVGVTVPPPVDQSLRELVTPTPTGR